MIRCPCGSGEPYESCCARYHRGEAEPPTALTLMRARYTAFARGDERFLAATWHPSTRPSGPLIDPSLSWTALHVTGQAGGGLLEDTGTVAFTARYLRAGVPGRLTENSRFVRQDGRWSYLGPA
ncbi:YchJ family protein [Jatrophihabitans sp.]|uniref:YchJ family protein n=1 Tax=Jatrophihabitans sp. TaxID=1932789 RepID=UPI002F24D13D